MLVLVSCFLNRWRVIQSVPAVAAVEAVAGARAADETSRGGRD
jgi:hypothetical protein